ncbi:MAG: ThuA domain-containing protein [Verrucomicrobia bacterium]|nr:ThuA domain-containing protein [Verrucomicrobiota bacterium]
MKTSYLLRTVTLWLAWMLPCLAVQAADTIPAGRTRVLVVTGGHGFEREPFLQMFKDNPDITFTVVEHPQAHAMFKAEAAQAYDVVVLYDMWQQIDAAAKADFTNLVAAGKGVVALHHCLGSYQDWPEYTKIIGGLYYLQARTVGGAEKPASVFKEDLDLKVKVADPAHPVTAGVAAEFAIHDETYGQFDLLPDSHPLLTTDAPTSDKVIGWCRTYGKARVVYLQGGHDHFAYANPEYRKLLANAIRWTVERK